MQRVFIVIECNNQIVKSEAKDSWASDNFEWNQVFRFRVHDLDSPVIISLWMADTRHEEDEQYSCIGERVLPLR